MYNLLREALFLLPPESSHYAALNALKLTYNLGLNGKPTAIQSTPIEVMGIKFPNRVGLAAGLDKNGEFIDPLASCGFGFIEIGTVTPRPQPGNPNPRLFRLKAAKAIINRMGFNNHGLDYLLGQVAKARYQGILGINIGKNFDTPVERAGEDYLIGLRRVYEHAHYVTINISSPNTPGLRSLQYGDELQRLLAALKQEQTLLADKHGRYIPLAVKVAPDLSPEEIAGIAEILLACKMDGLIATNTTLDKTLVSQLEHGAEQGGLSGQPLTQHSTEVIRLFHQHLGTQIPIIGVGGIMSAQDAQAKLQAGAALVQIYTGFIYAG
ncbi:MAG TPA: quinone-dependent dihydroorotate dehydrogenase, partial [Thiolinea sp.]|nr:quinone-dependent dihydroorotate dehydrogenase [Thiolinea sp.]